MDEYEQAMALDPDADQVQYQWIHAKAAQGDPDGALADWRRAHELDPEDFAPVYASAFLLEEPGR